MDNNHGAHTGGHGIMGLVFTIGINLVAWLLAILDHFLKHPLQITDLLLGFLVKGLAITASVYTIILVRKKLKKIK